MDVTIKIGFGGGCHWCTEAVFQVLKGVKQVEQGYVASDGAHHNFSEAVIVHYDPKRITLKVLIEIHLHTHKSTSTHTMRKKYRSAIYTFSDQQHKVANAHLEELQPAFNHQIITEVYPFVQFKASRKAIQNYYIKNPEKPFCQKFINPKLNLLLKEYSEVINHEYITKTITTNT